ncbi:MAG: hypothetical protein IKB45_00165 [Clostridia bacterium]|nr:hypothetical protein [Clostridia bacterium]
MANCKKCGAVLSFNEVGLYKKLIDMEPKEFLCKSCLAEYFNCSTDLLDKKIGHFIYLGCTLFENNCD